MNILLYTRNLYSYSHFEIFICIYSIGVRYTKCQQIHPDVAPAVQQMFTFFSYWIEYRIVPLNTGTCLYSPPSFTEPSCTVSNLKYLRRQELYS